ncbi:MAG: methylmalonyl-CoA epimerase [Maricaulaceae bacterium]|jgi:methylmalonyl-CoA/ethylmalonyl-CoA epimerase
MLGRLNHIGVATPSLAEAVETYRKFFGDVPVSDVIELAEQKVRVQFVDAPNSQIELLEPLGEEGPIASFLEKNPRGGQHHVAFEVDDIWAAKADMEEKGATVLNEPRIGAHGTLVVFVHPRDFHGVLIELMERPEH